MENPWVYQYTVTCGFILFIFCRQFTSEDPALAPPSSLLRLSPVQARLTEADDSTLTKTLLEPSLSLFVGYWAFFTLRSIGTPGAIDALSSALLSPNETCSLLLKHAVAFVFGQMSDPHFVSRLKVLADEREGEMVRTLRSGGGSWWNRHGRGCCESGPLETTHPGWSGKAVWWRSTYERCVVLLTSN